MENRRIRHPFWILLCLGVVAWVILGFTLDQDDFPANDVFDFFAVGVFLMCLLFVVIYTIAGLTGPKPRSKWWTNEVGTYLVLSFIAIMFIVGPTAFAIAFNGGMINTWWWAWTWIGGHAMAAIMIGALSILWIRNFLAERKRRKAD